jgi:THO complex subunit 1 transcription elongation factor
VHDGSFGWRALRLMARRSPHFFTHSNSQISKLPAYLEMMVKKIAKDLPVSLFIVYKNSPNSYFLRFSPEVHSTIKVRTLIWQPTLKRQRMMSSLKNLKILSKRLKMNRRTSKVTKFYICWKDIVT